MKIKILRFHCKADQEEMQVEKRAIEIKAGDTIMIEYGAHDNFVKFKVRAVFSTDAKIMVLADSKVGNETFVFRPDEKVMVVPRV